MNVCFYCPKEATRFVQVSFIRGYACCGKCGVAYVPTIADKLRSKALRAKAAARFFASKAAKEFALLREE